MKSIDWTPNISSIGDALKRGLPQNHLKQDARIFKSVYDTGYTTSEDDGSAGSSRSASRQQLFNALTARVLRRGRQSAETELNAAPVGRMLRRGR